MGPKARREVCKACRDAMRYEESKRNAPHCKVCGAKLGTRNRTGLCLRCYRKSDRFAAFKAGRMPRKGGDE